MWIVFATFRLESTGSTFDEYHIVETEEEAKERYDYLLKDTCLYCAGYSKLIEGTDWENEHE